MWMRFALQGSSGVHAGGMVNVAGRRVLPDSAALAATLADFANTDPSTVLPVLGAGAASWPCAMYNHFLLRIGTMADPAKARALVDWTYWALTSPAADQLARENYVLTTGGTDRFLRRAIETLVSVTVDGVHVSSIYPCVGADYAVCSGRGTCVCPAPWQGQYCETDPSAQGSSGGLDTGTIVAIAAVPSLAVAACVFPI